MNLFAAAECNTRTVSRSTVPSCIAPTDRVVQVVVRKEVVHVVTGRVREKWRRDEVSLRAAEETTRRKITTLCQCLADIAWNKEYHEEEERIDLR